MFKVEDVTGKGKGCLANRRIEAGELILREEPALLLQPRWDQEVDDEEGKEEEVETLEAFQAMSNDQQTSFLELANMFNREGSEWPSVMLEYKESIREDVEKALEHNAGLGIDLETAVEVVEIKETNSFHNGVFLRMSRFDKHHIILTFSSFEGSTTLVVQMRNISGMTI